jgi:hypothetical protein
MLDDALVNTYLCNVPRDGAFHIKDGHPGCVFRDGIMAFQILPAGPNRLAIEGMASALVYILNARQASNAKDHRADAHGESK